MNKWRDINGATFFFLVSALVVLPIVIIYWPMMGHMPVLDDPVQITYVQSFNSIADCFKTDSNNWFRPFKNLVFYLTYSEESGIQWTAATCLGIFAINIYLIAWLFAATFGNRWWGILGAAVFAFNPTMVSSVQFLSACNNQLALTFICGMLLLALRYAQLVVDRPDKPAPMAHFAAAMFCLMLALVAYEAAVSAVGMLVIWVWAKHGWRFLLTKHGIRLWGGGVCILLVYLLIRMDAAKVSFESPSLPIGVTRLDLILRAPYYAWTHFLLWVEPWGRGGVFMDDDPRGLLAAGLVGWALLIALAVAMVSLLFTRYRVLAAGVLFYLGAMVPLSNFLGLANGPICNYYLLIPGLGLALTLVEGCRLLWAKRLKALRYGMGFVGLALIVGGLWETRQRVIAWQKPETLQVFSIQNYPDNYYALTQQAFRWILDGRHDEAVAQLTRAQDLAPWSMRPYTFAAYSLRLRGEPEKALEVLQKHADVNGYLTWIIGERIAEVHLQMENWAALDDMVTRLLEGVPPPGEECRFYVYVVIPYFIRMNRLEDARILVDALTSKCSGNATLGNLLQTQETYLNERRGEP